MEPTKVEIKRIGAFSTVKTMFLLGGFSGFVLGLVQWLFMQFLFRINQSIQPGLYGQPGIDEALDSMVGITGVLLPFMGGFAGAAVGVVGGFLLTGLYNLGARIWGGLEIEWAPLVSAVTIIPTARPSESGQPTPLPSASTPAETPPPPQDPDDHAPDKPRPSLFE